MGFDGEHPATLQESMDGGTQTLKIGILKNPLTVQSKKFPGISVEISWQQKQGRSWCPALLQLKNLTVE